MPSVEAVREFAHQIDKALIARRLYNPASAPWREAADRLLEKCRAAAGDEGFAVRVGPTDLFLDKTSILNRPKREESFFFPLYRDGLRELTFGPETSRHDIEKLLAVFETTDKDLGSADDMVNLLWRADLEAIAHSAIDGIGEVEEEGGEDAKDDFRGLVADLTQRIQAPAVSEGGQKYAFILDADVQVAQSDLHYDATTRRRAFEENPAILRIAAADAERLLAEVGPDRDDMLVERFIEILLLMTRTPLRAVPIENVAPIFVQLAEGYWNASDFRRLSALLAHLRVAGAEAPTPENRAVIADIITRFLSAARVEALVEELVQGRMAPGITALLFELVPEDRLWPLLLEALGRVEEGELKQTILGTLRRRLANNPALLGQTLTSSDPQIVRSALTLIDDRIERLFAKELLGMVSHPDESIRIKGLAAAARLGGEEAVEAIWKAMEGDPSKSVRLYAFRAIATAAFPGMASRLESVITSAQFADRPLWEREKYIRLLGTVAGEKALPLFQSWIPARKWLWQPKDFEIYELALRGLGACGERGWSIVEEQARRGGKQGDLARRVLDAISRAEVGSNTTMRPTS